MDYLTEYYKQLCESLEYIQEILTYKKILNEAKVSPTDVDFLTIQARGEDALSQLKNKYGNIKENLPPNLRSDLESYTKAMQGEIQKQPTYQPTKTEVFKGDIKVPRFGDPSIKTKSVNFPFPLKQISTKDKWWHDNDLVKGFNYGNENALEKGLKAPSNVLPKGPKPPSYKIPKFNLSLPEKPDWGFVRHAHEFFQDVDDGLVSVRGSSKGAVPVEIPGQFRHPSPDSMWKGPFPKAEDGGKVVSEPPVKPTDTTPKVTKPSTPNAWEDASKSLKDLRNKNMIYRVKKGTGVPVEIPGQFRHPSPDSMWKGPFPKAEDGGKVVSEPPVHSKPKAPQIQTPKSSLGSKIGSGIKGVAGLGAGLVGYDVARGAYDKATKAIGVEDGFLKDLGGEVVGGAGGGAATALTTAALSGAAPTAAAIGSGMLSGAGVAGAAYAGYKAGEAISNIEIDKKGTQVSDVLGKAMYDAPLAAKIAVPGLAAVQMGTNWLAGNKLTASSADLNEKPKGVAGGDQAKIAQNQKEDEEEKAEMARKQAAEKSRVEGRAARIAQKVAAFKAGETPK